MIAALIMLGVFLLSNMPSPIYPLWQSDLGYSTATITLLFSLYQGGVLIGLLGLGRFIDKIGWRVSLIGGTTLSLMAALIFASAHSPEQLMLGRLFSGIAAGIFVSSGPAAVTAILENKGHPKPSLVSSLAISIGLAFGPLLGGLFADYLPSPTQTVFMFEAILLLIGAILLLVNKPLKAAASFHLNADVTPMIDEHNPLPHPKTLFIAVTIIFASCYITSGIYMSIGSAYLQQTLAVNSAFLAGVLVFLVFGSAFVAQMLLAKFSPLTQSKVALFIGGTGAIILVIGTMQNSAIALFVSAIFSGASQGLGQLVGLTLIRRITKLHQLRRAYAILNTVGYGASGGSIAASWPLFGLLGTIGAIIVIASCVVFLTIIAAVLTAVHKESMC